MNPQITNLSKTIADNYASNSDRVLDAVLDGNRKFVDAAVTTLDQLIEQLPAAPVQVADRLPTPAEAGARYLEFVERAVEINREWNDRVVAMLTVGQTADVVAEPTPAPAKKAVAKRAPAKRTAKKAPAKRAAAKRTAAK
jgi:hypothetical protein